MSKIVYRHYQSPEEFEAYLHGRWSGPGTHGRLDLSLEEDVQCALSADKGQMELSGRPARRGGFFRRLISFSGARGRSFSETIPLDEAHCMADLAEISTEHLRVVVQAMTEKRMHLLIEKKGSPPVLEFSGVLNRK